MNNIRNKKEVKLNTQKNIKIYEISLTNFQ